MAQSSADHLVMAVKVYSFEKEGKNYPCIELKNRDDGKFGFTFGLSKARLILENYEDIRDFVRDNMDELEYSKFLNNRR